MALPHRRPRTIPPVTPVKEITSADVRWTPEEARRSVIIRCAPLLRNMPPPARIRSLDMGRHPRGIALVAGVLLLEALAAKAFVARPLPLAGVVVAGLGVALAITRPRAMGVCALLCIALVPVYAAPQFGALELQPAVCAFWLCALGAAILIIGRNERVALGPVDIAAALFAVATFMSVVAGARTPTQWVQNTFYWLGPYLGLRLLLARRLDARWLPRAFALSALTVIPFAFYEFVTGKNLFLHLAFNKIESAVWATTQTRLGVERVDASFGHAIAFGMFMASALLFALTLAASSERRGSRLRWLGVALLFLGGLAVSTARTGLGRRWRRAPPACLWQRTAGAPVDNRLDPRTCRRHGGGIDRSAP